MSEPRGGDFEPCDDCIHGLTCLAYGCAHALKVTRKGSAVGSGPVGPPRGVTQEEWDAVPIERKITSSKARLVEVDENDVPVDDDRFQGACEACEGTGTLPNWITACPRCHGRGAAT